MTTTPHWTTQACRCGLQARRMVCLTCRRWLRHFNALSARRKVGESRRRPG